MGHAAGRERSGGPVPDETAVLARVSSLSETPQWRWDVEVSVPVSDERRRWIWGASIDEAAPPAALAGFVAALTDPAPLLRDEGQTTGHTFGFLDSIRSVVTPEQHRLRHLQRLEAAQRPGPPEQSPTTPHHLRVRHDTKGVADQAPAPHDLPLLSSHARTLMPTPSVPSDDQVAQVTATLAQVKNYLRTDPPVSEVLPLLAGLLDEDTGVPILLGDILRSAARLVAQQTARPETDEIRLTTNGLRQAAQEATDWHVLHWDVQHLNGHAFEPAGVPTAS
jgi:hypothetical protein